MKDHEPALRRFFEAYAARLNAALESPPRVDVAAAVSAFAGYFVGSGPAGPMGGSNGWFLRFSIPHGYAFYRRIGTQRMEVRGLRVTPIDDFHAMAHTHWWSSYRRRSDGATVEIEFDNVYILHIPGRGDPKIFAWITGDEQQVLKDHGLV